MTATLLSLTVLVYVQVRGAGASASPSPRRDAHARRRGVVRASTCRSRVVRVVVASGGSGWRLSHPGGERLQEERLYNYNPSSTGGARTSSRVQALPHAAAQLNKRGHLQHAPGGGEVHQTSIRRGKSKNISQIVLCIVKINYRTYIYDTSFSV
jgi:hypothetical protein